MSLPSRFLLVALLAVLVACERPAGRASDYCASIAPTSASADEVVGLLDAFALENRLQVDRSSPSSRRYVARSGDETMAFLGVGEFGTVLAHFPGPEANEAHAQRQRLGAFLQGREKAGWRVRQCKDIPGFTPPTRYG